MDLVAYDLALQLSSRHKPPHYWTGMFLLKPSLSDRARLKSSLWVFDAAELCLVLLFVYSTLLRPSGLALGYVARCGVFSTMGQQ